MVKILVNFQQLFLSVAYLCSDVFFSVVMYLGCCDFGCYALLCYAFAVLRVAVLRFGVLRFCRVVCCLLRFGVRFAVL